MQRRGCIVLAAALSVFGGACGSGDDGDSEAFDLTGRVVSVEPAAQPANAPSDANVTGAIVVQTAAPEDCETDADGVRVYLTDDTSVAPANASDDLEKLQGKTVTVSGDVSKDGDACTAIADSVATQGASTEPSDDSGGTNGGGATNGGGGPSSTSEPDATASPNDPDDEGSIGDTEETASPAPKNPDDHGVMNDDNSGKGGDG